MQLHSWTQIVDAILLRKLAFLTAFFVVFISTYTVLSWFDFLPEPKSAEVESSVVVDDNNIEGVKTEAVEPKIETVPVESTVATIILPKAITIEALDKTITVLNPESREIAALDEALLSGVVRHPDSATLGQSGTVFILGHSSYLPSVRNKNFQAFNGIQNLKWGDIIEVTALEGKFIYRVEKVYRANAQEITVPIAGDSNRLVLATCNSFGTKDDRYIVEAELIETNLY